jgi:flagellar hook assembly protein FlgD
MVVSNSKVKEVEFLVTPDNITGATAFNITLPDDGTNLEIRIYDNLGRLVDNLKMNFKRSGDHSMSFDTSKIVNGTYYFIAEARNRKSVGKLNIKK